MGIEQEFVRDAPQASRRRCWRASRSGTAAICRTRAASSSTMACGDAGQHRAAVHEQAVLERIARIAVIDSRHAALDAVLESTRASSLTITMSTTTTNTHDAAQSANPRIRTRCNTRFPGMIHDLNGNSVPMARAGHAGYVNGVALELFDRFGRGAPKVDPIAILRSSDPGVGMQVGDTIQLNPAHFPNAGYRFGDNPSMNVRVMQIIRRTEEYAGHTQSKLSRSHRRRQHYAARDDADGDGGAEPKRAALDRRRDDHERGGAQCGGLCGHGSDGHGREPARRGREWHHGEALCLWRLSDRRLQSAQCGAGHDGLCAGAQRGARLYADRMVELGQCDARSDPAPDRADLHADL